MKGKDALFLFFEAARLRIIYELTLMTPAKEIKRMKLREIKKEMEFISGSPRAKVNYKIVGITDSKARKEKE